MAAKSRKTTKAKHPTAAMLRDLKAVFKKHDWPGHPVGLMTAAAIPGPDTCPNGSEPQIVSFQLPDGTQVTKKMCL